MADGRGLRSPTSPSSMSAPPPSHPALSPSPIVQLLPTGYRDIQPLQRGQGWHTNRPATKLRRPRGDSATAAHGGTERVVFPMLPGQQPGPKASSVLADRDDGGGGNRDEDDPVHVHGSPVTLLSTTPTRPSASPRPVPVPPTGPTPRRPASRGESNQRGAPGSLRGHRGLATTASTTTIATKPTAPTSPRTAAAAEDDDDDDVDDHSDPFLPPPDAETMERLWQEYAERTRHPTRTIDPEAYHRRMHHRYNEMKLLRERLARLELELDETRRERDEARSQSQRSLEQAVVKRWKEAEDDPEGDDAAAVTTTTTSPRGLGEGRIPSATKSRRSLSQPSASTNASTNATAAAPSTDLSFRDQAFKLERALATTKESVAQMQARLLAMHETDKATIETLRAQLELEKDTSRELSLQLRETNAAFKATANELVTTQVALEKETAEKQGIIGQIQAETRQLISDHRRKELQSRVKNVVRTLGKDALRQKMEALHTRALMAEHHMRAAQLEVEKLRSERVQQQQQLEAILESREIKYHTLAPKDGGIPGILGRATSLYHGSRTLDEQFVLVHMLYEDTRGNRHTVASPEDDDEDQNEPVEELEDGFSIHILIYEALTAQDDYLTFHLRDIRRLVPDAAKYLARHSDRRQERYLALAELLLLRCRLGYKNGHVVLSERPLSLEESIRPDRVEVTIYRGHRFVPITASGQHNGTEFGEDDGDDYDDTTTNHVLLELVVNEVYAPSVSQLWWLEIQAARIDGGAGNDGEYSLRIDSQLLKASCPTFAAYRPSECMESTTGVGSDSGAVDAHELFGIHEELLDPLMEQLVWRFTDSSPSDAPQPALVLMDVDGTVLAPVEDITSDDDPLTAGSRPVTALELLMVAPSATASGAESSEARAAEVDMDGALSQAQESTSSVLDHRSIVGVDGHFYCLRIQETWDGELLVLISMEEPEDATCRRDLVLRESEIADLASYVHSQGLCGSDHREAVKFGLPVELHAPLCCLLKKHVRPSSENTRGLSLGGLFDEVTWAARPGAASASALTSIPLPGPRKVLGHHFSGVVVVATDDITPDVADAMAWQLATEPSIHATAERRGYRSIRERRFVLASVYRGFHEHDALVAVLVVPMDTGQSEPVLALARASARQVLVAMGLRVPVLDG